jgi:tryptophan synthase alpha subunit
VPFLASVLDSPEIGPAYRRSFQHGTQMSHVLESVRQAASTTSEAVVVMSYWNPIFP